MPGIHNANEHKKTEDSYFQALGIRSFEPGPESLKDMSAVTNRITDSQRNGMFQRCSSAVFQKNTCTFILKL